MDGNIEAIKQGTTNIHIASQVSHVENPQQIEASKEPTNIEVVANESGKP